MEKDHNKTALKAKLFAELKLSWFPVTIKYITAEISILLNFNLLLFIWQYWFNVIPTTILVVMNS